MSTVDDNKFVLPNEVARIVSALGYDTDRDFITDPVDDRVVRHRHALAAAFDRMCVVGAFCPSSRLAGGAQVPTPVVYVVACTDADQADRAHRAIWSQSLAPLIVLITSNGFQVRNGFNYRSERGRLFPWSEWPDKGVHPALSGLRAESLRTSLAWQHFSTARMSRVDQRLYRSIKDLNRSILKLSPELTERTDLVNALIGRVLYLLVLIDRGVVTQADVDQLTDRKGRRLCPDMLLGGDSTVPQTEWPAKQFWTLLDAIDDDLNGTIFPIRRADRSYLGDHAINLVRNVLRRDDIAGDTVQYGFLDVDYSALRTETISAIYEQFFAVEDEQAKADDGAFYTPAYLVDYVLDELDGINPVTSAAVVCDPAAGSGAFLVAAYRRAVERAIPKGDIADPEIVKRVLVDVVHGMEKNAQAANVARFSLYLTMLDYLPHATWGSIRQARAASGNRLFPDLRNNVATVNFFDDLPTSVRGRITHVVGNPPWTRMVEGDKADTYRKRLPSYAAVAYGNLAELFAWRALLELSAPGGSIALVLAARSFIGSKVATEDSFPTAFAAAGRIHGITNLSHFRRKLFDKAGEAAVVVFASKQPFTSLDWTWRYSPLLASQPLDANGKPWAILVDRGNVERSRQVDLLGTDRQWFQNLMLQPLDRVFAERLASISDRLKLGAFFDRAGLRVNRGGYQPETGIPAKYHLGTKKGPQYYRTMLGLAPNTVRTYALPPNVVKFAKKPYDQMFKGNVLLVPRAQNHYDVIESAVAFSSSILGVYFAADGLPADTQRRVLCEIAAFMQSSAARYLMAIVGKAWILEQRRFEATDMLRLPFPYDSVDELLAEPPSLTLDDDLTKRIGERCELGDSFGDVVEEYRLIRSGYQNGKVPAAARRPVEDQARTSYENMLWLSLSSMFGATTEVVVGKLDDASGEAIDTIVTLRRMGSCAEGIAPATVSRDLATGAVTTISGTTSFTSIRISKPPALSAWTLDRAYADAMNIVKDVLAS